MEAIVGLIEKGLPEDLADKMVSVSPGDEFGAVVYNRLPPQLQESIDPFDEDFKRDFVLMGIVPTISGLLFNTTFKYREGKVYYPNLYGLVVAKAGSSKSLMTYGEYLYQDILTTKTLFKIPGDSSSAAFLKFLIETGGVGMFLESEIDTLTKGFEQKWGDHSDLFRLGFENETVSKMRAGDESPLIVQNPRFAIALSGTPNQVGALIKSYSNGMFSRFMLYIHKGVKGYKNWGDCLDSSSYEAVQDTLSDIGDNLYDSQWHYSFEVKFQRDFIALADVVGAYWEGHYGDDDDMRAVCRRGVVMAIKIAVVFTFLKQMDTIESSAPFYADIECLVAAIAMVSVSIANASEYIFKAREEQLPHEVRAIYQSLPKDREFSTAEAKAITDGFGIHPSTTQRTLMKLCGAEFLRQVKHGVYSAL